MRQWSFVNARIVTADRVVDGSLSIDETEIAAINRITTDTSTHDCDGDYLLPGVVELHTDNLEKHVTPRPGAVWPMLPAVLAHDAQVAAAGITTVFDAIALGDVLPVSFRTENLEAMADGIEQTMAAGLLRADHFLHLRCEVCFPTLIELIDRLIDRPCVKFASIMDHTPGQRQFTSMEKYAGYYQVKYNLSDAEFAAFVRDRRAEQQTYAAPHRQAAVQRFHERGIPVASHDDASAAHVDDALRDGLTVAEFPTTIEAAAASKSGGMAVMMGAPNFLRGGSHSGNVSARDLAERGLIDILSSDYVPASLIPAAFQMAEFVEDISLPQAVRSITLEPARRVGLDDRGEIAPGKLADLVQVRPTPVGPAVVAVWKRGVRVL